MLRSTLVRLAVLVGATAMLAGCPPEDPDVPCPPCAYDVAKGKLVGTMSAKFSSPYPFKNLVVTLKTSDGLLHPFAVSSPSQFTAGMSFEASVTSSITAGVATVSARWEDAMGAPVDQDGIPPE